jgi:hypothetical protein
MKLQGTVRNYPAGTAANGLGVSIVEATGDTEIGTDTTDADGRWSYTQNGSPGDWYWEVLDTAPDPDVTRSGSSGSYGSGGAYSLYELVYALRALGNGVIGDYLNELEVTYDAAGLDLDINTGGAIVRGVPAIFSAVTDLTSVGTQDGTNPKACYVVLEVTPPGNADEGKAEIKASCGAAAASPSLPALTQSEVLYQLPLATYTLPASPSTTLADVTDARTYANTRNPVVSGITRRADPTDEITTTSTTNTTMTSMSGTITLVSGVTYDVECRAAALVKISTSAQTVSLLPYINSTSDIADAIATNSEDYVLLSNVHTATVVGAGSMGYGLRWKVSGGTGTAQTGIVSVIARPRS